MQLSPLKESKKQFINDGIVKSGKNTQQVWKHLRYVVPGKDKNNCINKIKVDDNIESTDPQVISNTLNNYFANIGPSLAKKIEEPDDLQGHDTNVSVNDTECTKFTLKPVSHECVLEHIQSLSENKATGVDNISAKLLQKAGVAIVDPIAHIINLSLQTSTFPDSWKRARLNPIYKSGDHTDPSNYRPIAILPVLSKICEKVVFAQVYEFLNDKLYSCQSGFRPLHSTTTALLNVTDDWFNAIDKGNVVGLVMLDLKKAFDTVNHSILIEKLKMYNLDDKCIKWFESYLFNRTHCTSINGVTSKRANSQCGIPQGSILGPLLFIAYINDLPQHVSTNTTVSMYADDTAMYTTCRNVNELNRVLNNDLCNVSNWLARNKLSLNVAKTELIIIGSKQRLSQINDGELNVHINETNLKRVKTCKHLGFIIDENLSWNEHVNQIEKKKAAFSLYTLRKASPVVPRNIMCMLYNCILLPHFDYGDNIWGTCNVSSHHKVQKLQNRAAKIITGSARMDSSTEARNKLKWLNLKERYQFHLAVNMFKVMNGQAPNYLANRFNIKDSGYALRGYKNLSIPKPRTEFKKRSFSYCGATLWNSLPDAIKSSCNLSQFKKKYSSEFI